MNMILQFVLFSGCCLLLLLEVVVESKTSSSLSTEFGCPKHYQQQNSTTIMLSNNTIGVVIDQRFRVGKEQRVAMELAVQDFQQYCLINLLLRRKDPHGNSAPAASAAIDLLTHKQVDAILGTVTFEEASLLSELKTVNTSNIPIISISPTASSPHQMPPKLPSFVQMSSSIAHQTQCIAAIVSHFKWRKVILVHEQGTSFSEDSSIFTHLSVSLRAVDSSVEHHIAIPRISSLLDPEAFIAEELKKLRTKNVRIFVVAQSSLEFAVALFEKAMKLGMMGKGYVWIASDEIANLLDSVDLKVIFNMQGVLGLKTDYADTNKYFREFKSRFRRKYVSEYPAEEENSTPSIYSLLAYDAIWILAKALLNSQGKIDSTIFEGLSGNISFKNGLLPKKPVFQIVNVIGRSYREVALWSPELGFSTKDLVDLDRETVRSGNGLTRDLSSIYWPGGEQTVPKGWIVGSRERPLRIGVPAKGAFNWFVNVTYDPGQNQPQIRGFSIEVFNAAKKQLPYDLHCVFVPSYGSYDDMVIQVHNKSLDAAVGDTTITAYRYVYAEFSQPYMESGLVMVTTAKPRIKDSRFIALNAFTKKMWIQLIALSMSTGAIIWLSEYATGNEQFPRNSFFEVTGSILWLSVTIISFSQRQNIKDSTSKLVLAAWICVVFVVGASFTAVLSSMMTVPRLQPSFVDIDYLLKTNAVVGCNGNSFIVRYLIDVLHFKTENVKKMYSIDEYPKHFQSGDITAAFFVAPHAKVFLSKYCKGYTISGPSFKLGGFGFVFPKGSPLAVDISEAILKVTQSGHVNTLEKHMLYENSNCLSATSKEATDEIKLGPEPFSGLFQVLGGAIGLAFFIATLRLVRMRWTGICGLMQKELIKKRICLWVSLVLTQCCSRFGSTSFKQRIIRRNAPDHDNQMEPNLVSVQMAVTNR